MSLNAKSVVKDKFWIVERDGEKVGTVQAVSDGVVFVDTNSRRRFPSVSVLSRDVGIHFERPAKKTKSSPAGDVYGFPVDVPRAYNALYNVVHRVPVYTKEEKSKSMFCAGYYLVRYNDTWEEVFCPKLIVINRYPFRGPFYSEQEMRQVAHSQNV